MTACCVSTILNPKDRVVTKTDKIHALWVGILVQELISYCCRKPDSKYLILSRPWCNYSILLFYWGREAMTNLDSIFQKQRHYFANKGPSSLNYGFPIVMYGCESWTIKKAEHWRINAFELWCWRLVRVPWTARRSNQSFLKEISPEYSLEGLMLKLKLQ